MNDRSGTPLLDKASLTLDAGSTTCIVGSVDGDQGALLSIALGVDSPRHGSVLFDGQEITGFPLAERRRRAALVHADPWIVDGTIADNIVFGRPGVTARDVERAAGSVGLDELIASLPDGYDTVVGTGGVSFGIGRRRQLATARAVLTNPSLLAFDEPTSGLDGDEEREMLQTIELASAGRTTMLTTHRLSLARRSGAVYVIDGGQIIPYNQPRLDRNGEVESLGTRPNHVDLWDLKIPSVVSSDGSGRSHLRLLRTGERRAPQPIVTPWDITIGAEMAPGYLASGLLGRDDHTETWVAWSVEREEPVRIKVPRHDPVTYPAFEQLLREFKALTAIGDARFAAVHEADLEAEMPHVVLEYLDSPSLAADARRTGGVDPIDVLAAGFELAAALTNLHRQGYANVKLRSRDVRTRSGVTVVTDGSHLQEIGSPIRHRIAPPEVASLARRRVWKRPGSSYRAIHQLQPPELAPGAPIDPKMDVFFLGSLLHRITAGPVVTNSTSDGLALAPYATLTSSAPDDMASIIDRMLASTPDARPTAEEVECHFRRILPRSLVRPKADAQRTRSRRLRVVSNA